jgi:hypothetical protein
LFVSGDLPNDMVVAPPPPSVLVQFGAHLQSTGIEIRFRGYALIRDGNVVRWFARSINPVGDRQLSGDTQLYELTRHPVLRGPCKQKLPPPRSVGCRA